MWNILISACLSALTLQEVKSENSSNLLEDADALLGDTDGLTLSRTSEGQYEVEGQIERVQDLKHLKDFIGRNPQVADHSQISKSVERHILAWLERKSRDLEPTSKVSSLGKGRFKWEGSSEVALDTLKKSYPYIEPSKVVSRTFKKDIIQPSIFLEIALVEVKKSALKKWGFRLKSPLEVSGIFTQRLLPKADSSAALGTDFVRSFLDLAAQNGEARIHAKESLVTENDKVGEFQAGGEFPIKVSGLSSYVEFKKYGLILKFRPHLLKAPMIHLEVTAEISEIDMGSLVDGYPVLSKKELKTQLSTRLNEMMAIGGVLRNSQSQFADKIPGLSAIPYLGRLFRSEDFKNQRSEAYIFVTPKILTGAWLPSSEF